MNNQVVVAFTIQQAQALLDAFVQYPRSLLEKNVNVCGALDAIESTLVNEHGEEYEDQIQEPQPNSTGGAESPTPENPER